MIFQSKQVISRILRKIKKLIQNTKIQQIKLITYMPLIQARIVS